MNRHKLLREKDRIGSWGQFNWPRAAVVLKFAGRKIIDVGCASCLYVEFLAKKGYDAFGLDLFPPRELRPRLAHRFIMADICHLPFKDQEFDTVLAFEVLEHIPQVDQALEEMIRVARHNLILSVPDAELYPFQRESGLVFFPWADRSHVNFFTEKSLIKWLTEKNLKIRLISRINPVFPERILLESLGLPARVARFLQKFFRVIPRKKKFRMTLLVVAEKKRKNGD